MEKKLVAEERITGNFKEVFLCICGTIEKVCQISYFTPSKEDTKDEDDIIFFTILASQWRTCFFPSLFSIKELFNKKNREYTPLSKKYWEDWYYYSTWKRWEICLKYLFYNDIKEPLFDVITIDQIDCKRFLNILEKLKHKENKEETKEVVVHSDDCDWSLRINLDIMSEKVFEYDILHGISFEPIFSPRKGIKKFFYILKYLFNYKCNCIAGHFMFDRKTTAKIESLTRKVTECPTQQN